MFSTPVVDYLAGVAGGIAVCFVGHPFDTVKTRLQTSPSGFYQGTMDCVRKTIRKEGISGFYAGVMSPLAGQMFFRAFSFMTFHQSVKMLKSSHQDEISDTTLLLAGGMTGFAISFIETPIDLVKTKLQIQIFYSKSSANKSSSSSSSSSRYRTVSQCIRYIANRHGITALWQGLSSTIIRNVPANAVFFPVNEIIKNKLAASNNIDVKDLKLHHRLIAGGCAGLSYWVGMYPLDRIKGQIMSTPFSQNRSYLHIASQILQREGWKGMYIGLAPCAARSAPACATMFATVDIIRNLLSS